MIRSLRPRTRAALPIRRRRAAAFVAAGSFALASMWTVGDVGRARALPEVADQVHLAWVADPATSLEVLWHTTDAVGSQLQFRSPGATTWTTATGAVRPSGVIGRLHQVSLRNLAPASQLEYRVLGNGGSWSGVYTARTAPPPGPADFDAIYFADTGIVGRTDGLAEGTAQVIDEIAAMDAEVLLPGGDYAYYNSETRFATLDRAIDAWFDQVQPFATRTPMMPVYGNHEALLGESVSKWQKRFPTPNGYDSRRNYSFDIGDAHFVAIHAVAGGSGLSSGLRAWIEQDISQAQAAGKDWIIPYFHVSPFADGANHPSNLTLRSQLGPLFERLGIDVVLASHDQSFERTWPLVDVPGSNTPTSSSLTCYASASDGVTWVKVSPGGKLSNKNDGFSQWRTVPPPSFTAARDNTMHHFARLRIAAAGTLRVETWGVTGHGDPPVLVDSFEYRKGGCGPVQPALTFSPAELTFAADPAGAPASEAVSLGTSPAAAAGFAVTDDASWLTVTPSTGTTPTQLILTASPAGLAPGTYTANVRATAAGHTDAVARVTFNVGAPSARALLVSSSPDRSAPIPLAGATVAGNAFIFVRADAGITRVQFWLDDPTGSAPARKNENNAPWDFAGSAQDGSAFAFDTGVLSAGAHVVTARVTSGATTETIHATFTK